MPVLNDCTNQESMPQKPFTTKKYSPAVFSMQKRPQHKMNKLKYLKSLNKLIHR